jgi:hypothetical protein
MKALLLLATAGLLMAAHLAWAQRPAGSTQQPAGQTGGQRDTQPATGQRSDEKITDDRNEHVRLWEANLPGGSYVVALDRITSVSRHSYTVVEAGMLIDEVVVDTVGQTVARFYLVRPVTDGLNNNAVANINNRVKELVDHGAARLGTNVHESVTKKYPEGLYARTVEYRVGSEAELAALFGSVRSAWVSGRGRVFRVKSN